MNLKETIELANTGNSQAQADLAYRYSVGDGVPKDTQLSRKWNELAAAAGHPFACFNLAQDHLDGTFAGADPRRALTLFTQAWHAGGTTPDIKGDAALNIGWILRNGLAGEPEILQARAWYLNAARCAQPSAFFNLGQLELESHRHDDAAHFFRLGAALDHEGCIYELARLHVDRMVSNPDVELARKLLSCIAGSNHRAHRLLHSKKLAQTGESSARNITAQHTPNPKMTGTWDLDDSDVWFSIDADAATPVHCEDPDEALTVSDVRWSAEDLYFTSTCESTGWRVENHLLVFDEATLLVVRRGDTTTPTVACRRS